ncbi:oxygen-independent coproporphyrinogen III oxidase [bacterium DOLJORAL78_65_58]|nr:MAG: oxygen-independent coproporphyrinogen III oxidase [bacterium DOLZORAL124_64_63]PIE76019.1 MAG: oxygen-independent coproporphyrinogen III oxidase [bacterium DOLJORAL78_65_58]
MDLPISAEFVAKYNKPGPRYTSYPTVPAWKQPFGAADYRQALEELAGRPDDELALYLHLPFCAKHCHYCGCNAMVTRRKDAVTTYLDQVERELKMVTRVIGTGRKVKQLHWGGGTPNYLNEKETERALNLLRAHFDLEADAELSLEIDPRIASPQQVKFLREIGFNRISMGVQDFEARVQKAIGRRQSRERTIRVYEGCRAAGFAGVNVDLVYGLPGQTQASFTETLDRIIELAPDRLAVFSYAHVPWARPLQNKVDMTVMLTGYEKFQLFQLTVDMLGQAGYDWIGIDHFAKRDDELAVALRRRRLHRNFMGYATKPAPHMLAFGMSGIGDVCGRFTQNSPDLETWGRAVDAGELPVVKGHKLSARDKLGRLAILNVMCNLELPWDLTVADYGQPANVLFADSLKALPPLVRDGLVEVDDRGLRITAKGRYFVRNVAMILDAYLGREDGKPIFSKTV